MQLNTALSFDILHCNFQSYALTHSPIKFLEAAGLGATEISYDWIFKTVFSVLPSSNMTFCDSLFSWPDYVCGEEVWDCRQSTGFEA